MILPVSFNVLHTPEIEERRDLLSAQQNALGGIDAIRAAVRHYAVRDEIDLAAKPRDRTCWPNARRALLAGAEEAPYVIVITDDMLPGVGFFDAVRQMIRVRPVHPIGLFTLRRNIAKTVRDRGDRWFTSTGGIYGNGYLLPAATARAAVAWCDSHISPAYPHDDRRVSAYLMRTGQRVWQPMPSPMEHVGAGTSTLGQANRNRLAGWYEADLTGFDYTVVPADPVYLASGGRGAHADLIASPKYQIGEDW